MWPSPTVDGMSKDDCKKALRSLELKTYGGMVDVLRAQGHFSSEKKKLLSDIATALSIPLERHKSEVRRAVNDDRLNAIAEALVGPNTSTEWAIEGRRMIPLLPRPKISTVCTVVADECADYVSTERNFHTSEDAYKAGEFPFAMEPASPEASKTQVRSASPSGVLVFPSGSAIQMKREVQDEEETERKKRKAVMSESGQSGLSPTSPPAKILVGNQQQISMSSRTMASPFPPGSAPLKITLPTSGSRTPTTSGQPFSSTSKQQVIIVSTSASPNTPSILQKTLSVPMKAGTAKPTVMYAQGTGSNSQEGFKPRPKAIQSTPLGKPRPNTIVVSQKTPLKTLTPGKHGVPMHTKIVVQQGKGIQRGVAKPQHVVVQQKGGKQGVIQTNLQVKTAQGFANVPLQLRPGTKPLQIKQDPGGQLKMVSISTGAKILPKPSQPLYVVTATTSPLTMVTRTMPAGVPSRVMTVSTGGQMKWSQSPVSSKSLQSVQVVTQPRRHDGVVFVQKGTPGKAIVPHSSKETPGKTPTKIVQKPGTPISTSLAQSLQQLSSSQQSQSGTNLILLDLTNQEKVAGNSLADFLQASGILPEDTKAAAEDVEDTDVKEDKEESGKETTPVTTLSIEEAVEMLNRSDTPETRAILSQAGIQISDEIADSEEEEQIIEKSPKSDQQAVTIKSEVDLKSDGEQSSLESGFETDLPAPVTVSEASSTPITSSVVASAVHTLSTRTRSLDIFSTALASANINLDSFMEEEDDPEPTAKEEGKENKDSEITSSAADQTSDPLDMQLAELTGGMSQ